MDGNGDGEHNGRNRPQIHLLFFPRGDRPPADQLHAGVIAWMEFLFNHGIEDFHFDILLDVLQEPEHQHNADNNENHDNNDNNDNNENHDHNDNNENHDDDNDIDNDENHNNIDDIDNDENHDDNADIVNDENHDDIDDIDNDENHDDNDNDYHNGNVDDDVDNTDNHNVDHVDNDSESAEEAGPSAGVEVGVGANQGVEEDDLLPGGSRSRSRDEDGEVVEERSSKRFRWWDEFAENSTDSDSDNTDCDNNDTDKNTENSPVQHAGAGAEVSEEDPLSGPFRKRSRKHDKEEDEGSGKKSRQCYKFADSISDIVTATSGHDLAHSSSSIDPAEGAGTVEETDGEVNQQVEEEDPWSRRSRKRSRKGDDEEDRKRFKRDTGDED